MIVDQDLLYHGIGERLKQRRLELQMTQAQVAEAAGVLRTTVANLETGRQRAPLIVLYQLCSALGLETTAVLPRNSDVVRPSVVSVDIDDRRVRVPPKTAEILRRLNEQLEQGSGEVTHVHTEPDNRRPPGPEEVG
jgi:transcriptional regulator with XRE-family HTH domain